MNPLALWCYRPRMTMRVLALACADNDLGSAQGLRDYLKECGFIKKADWYGSVWILTDEGRSELRKYGYITHSEGLVQVRRIRREGL